MNKEDKIILIVKTSIQAKYKADTKLIEKKYNTEQNVK